MKEHHEEYSPFCVHNSQKRCVYCSTMNTLNLVQPAHATLREKKIIIQSTQRHDREESDQIRFEWNGVETLIVCLQRWCARCGKCDLLSESKRVFDFFLFYIISRHCFQFLLFLSKNRHRIFTTQTETRFVNDTYQ